MAAQLPIPELLSKEVRSNYLWEGGVSTEDLDAILAKQDEQIKKIHEAERLYELYGDVEALIRFWEDLWNSVGLLFNGSKWTFRLPDLYIKQKRYSDALKIVKKIKNPIYAEKKKSYIDKMKKAMKK